MQLVKTDAAGKLVSSTPFMTGFMDPATDSFWGRPTYALQMPDGHAPLTGVPSLAGQPRLFIENRLVMIREGLSDVPQMKGQLDGLSDAEMIALSRHMAGVPMKLERPPRDAARAVRHLPPARLRRS